MAEYSKWLKNSHLQQRDVATWGSYGKKGDEPLTVRSVAELSDSHIKAILKTQPYMSPFLRIMMLLELRYREEEGITVEDYE